MAENDAAVDWRLILSRAAVSATATVAAIVSYAHLQHVAEVAGEDWRSWLLPVSADGLVVAGSLAALQARAARRLIPATTWIALVVGLAVSIAANMLNAFLPRLTPEELTVLSAVVAAWPPVALALSFEQLLRLRAEAVTEARQPLPEAAEPTTEAVEALAEPADDLRSRAIAAVLERPSITGKQIGEIFGRSDSWGRTIKREAVGRA